MRTSEQIYHQVRWDPRFDPARFVLGVELRGREPKRIPLPAFTPGGDIPWHRVRFIEADGVLVWDRAGGVDRIDTAGAGLARRTLRLRAPFFTPRTARRWDARARAWAAVERDDEGAGTGGAASFPRNAPAAGPALGLRVLTWNVLWDRYDADRIDTARRRPLLLADLARADADVIALQEVEADLLAALLAQPWVRDGYAVTADARGRDVDEAGVLLLTRLPVLEAGWFALAPHKAVAGVVVATGGGPVAVLATHLSSDHSADGAVRRVSELLKLRDAVDTVAAADGAGSGDGTGPGGGVGGGGRAAGCGVVVVGDFNDGGDGPDGPAAMLRLTDAWQQVRGAEDVTPTFDPVANPLAAVSSLTGRAGRLDRVLLRGGGIRASAAVLRGAVPEPDGLFVSDHYGVQADLEFASDAAGMDAADVLDVPATARTALAWLPPESAWPALQEVRAGHDAQFDRWPPHVNVLFGFVPEADFEEAARIVGRALAGVPAFEVTLDGVRSFEHGSGRAATVWLDPAAAGGTAWQTLRNAVAAGFPGCRGRAEGYTPHLTLGTGIRGLRLAPIAAEVGELTLLSRRGDEPMRARAVVELGTGTVRWVDEPSASTPDQAIATPASPRPKAAAGPDAPPSDPPGPRESPIATAADAGADAATPRSPEEEAGPDTPASGAPGLTTTVPTAAAGTPTDPAPPPTRDDYAADALLAVVIAALPEATVHRVGSRRMLCHLPGADVDLVAVLPHADVTMVQKRLAHPFPVGTRFREVVGARVPGLRFHAFGLSVDLTLVETPVRTEAQALAFSAVTDADHVRALILGRRAVFSPLARTVKAWAHARGLDSAPFGGLPGFGWALLAAEFVAENDDARLGDFFGAQAARDWHLPLPTPTAPRRDLTTQISPGFRDLIADELYRAWELTDSAAPLTDLLAPPPMHRRHRAWAAVDIPAGPGQEAALGRVRGRLRSLLTAIEDAGCPDAHAWPRAAADTTTGLRLAVGLGRTPPDAGTLRALARDWERGLGGVRVELVPGGEMPTLR